MFTHTVSRRRGVALAALTALTFAAACTTDHPTATAPDPSPVESLAARYELTQVKGAALPVEIYAGLYFDADAGAFRDLRIVATEGYVLLRADGLYDQRVKMQAYIDGTLSGRPIYEDNGRWSPAVGMPLLSFVSEYSTAVRPFQGLAQNRTVRLSQDVTGGEAGAQPVEFTYSRP